MNPSPLRYPGGKYKLRSYITEIVKLNNCTTYIEPFAGGAALPLGLLYNNTVKKVIINDYDFSIYCFWESVLNSTDEFIEKIMRVNVDIDEWYIQKNVRKHMENYSNLDIGFSTFYLNRTNRSGIIDKAGPIGGINQNGNYKIDCRFNKEELIKKIKKIASYKNRIVISNMEALDFIDEVILNTRKSFTFFDPPYYAKGPGLYTNFYSHGDHKNLSNYILQKMKNRKWIVTYDNIDEVKDMYKKMNNVEFKLQYTLQNKCSGSEVMFFSNKVLRPNEEKNILNIM